MKSNRLAQSLVLAVAMAAGSAALAQVSFNVQVGPPPLLVEAVPPMPPGYVWAPGYWAWNHDRHIWVRGRSMMQRTGYRWEPDRWEQRGDGYVRQPGNWTPDARMSGPKAQLPERQSKPKKLKKDSHDNGRGRGGKND